MHHARLNCIQLYAPQRVHAALFDGSFRAEWIDTSLRDAMRDDGDEALRGLVETLADGVYSFPMLTPEACAMILDEADGYSKSGLPASRPNSMNKCAPRVTPSRRHVSLTCHSVSPRVTPSRRHVSQVRPGAQRDWPRGAV